MSVIKREKKLEELGQFDQKYAVTFEGYVQNFINPEMLLANKISEDSQTFKNIKKINYKNNNKWVVKPDDGAGCEKNYIFSDKNKMLNFVNSNTNYIIQPLIKGKSYSVNVISSKSNFRILNFNKQKILFDKEKITFNGTKFLKKIAYEKKIKKYINIIIKKLSGLNSFFGIDFIIFKQKILFVDINPRITTSYKELSKNMKINVAQQILNTTR